MTKQMRRTLRRTLISLFIGGFIFFAGFQAGSARFVERNAEEKAVFLKQIMETKDGTPEHTEAVLKLTRLSARTSAKEKSINFWLALLPSVLIAADILIHLFKKERST